MKRISLITALVAGFFLLSGAGGCSSNPNVEGAKLDLRNKDYDRALENLETALAADPNNAEALKLKGDVLMEKAFTVSDIDEHTMLVDQMVEAYNRSAEVDPANAEMVTQQKRVLYFREFERGVQAFNRGRDNAEEYAVSASYFGNASRIMPDSAGAYVNQAFSLINAGAMSDAMVPLEMAIEKGDTDPQTYIFLADIYRQNDRAGDAVTLLEKARIANPDDADIQANLLNAYQAAGQMDRALEVYRGAVEKQPDNKLYRYNYGSLLLQTEMYDEAITHLDAAVALDPDYANAHYNLGASYINKAVAVAEQINELDDKLRANRSEMSADDIAAATAEIDSMADVRRGLFGDAIGPLENAKRLTEAEGGDVSGICQALFSAYVQTGKQEMAKGVQECAGYDEEE